MESAFPIYVACTSWLIMGDFNIVPFHSNTDRKVLDSSIDLISRGIKPEGHYVLIKHNYS